MSDLFIWSYDRTEAIRASAIKSFIVHDSGEGGLLRWIVYGVDYDGSLTTLCLINSEENAIKLIEGIIEDIRKTKEA